MKQITEREKIKKACEEIKALIDFQDYALQEEHTLKATLGLAARLPELTATLNTEQRTMAPAVVYALVIAFGAEVHDFTGDQFGYITSLRNFFKTSITKEGWLTDEKEEGIHDTAETLAELAFLIVYRFSGNVLNAGVS